LKPAQDAQQGFINVSWQPLAVTTQVGFTSSVGQLQWTLQGEKSGYPAACAKQALGNCRICAPVATHTGSMFSGQLHDEFWPSIVPGVTNMQKMESRIKRWIIYIDRFSNQDVKQADSVGST
jgi:hypothetical protein